MFHDEIAAKIMTPEEAVHRFIPDGTQLALGGFTLNRNPMVIAREIIRQGKKDLYVVCHSHGQALDLLIGSGCVSRLEIGYGGTGRFAPTSIRFRKAVCAEKIQLEDYSNYHMSLRFLAGSMGLPFMPCKSGLETDLVKIEGFFPEDRGKGKVPRKKLVVTDNPFNGPEDKVILLPALNPDVALVHAQYVGDEGTVRIKGLTFADVEQARSAQTVIVTCEEIVPRSYIRNDPDQNSLPAFLVDAVVKAPYGAHPTATQLFYDYDPGHLRLYKEAASDDDCFKQYLDEWVYGLPTHEDYVAHVGVANLLKIQASPVLGYAPGLDRR